MKVLIDTNAYSAYKQRIESALEVVEFADEIGLPIIVLGELWAGFAAGNREARNRGELSEFLLLPDTRLVLLDEATATYYARVAAAQRQIGRPIPTNDLWIAAIALQHRYALFSLDGHFSEIAGLMVGRNMAELAQGR